MKFTISFLFLIVANLSYAQGIDFMAIYRGQEAANEANYRDKIRQLEIQSRQQAIERERIRFAQEEENHRIRIAQEDEKQRIRVAQEEENQIIRLALEQVSSTVENQNWEIAFGLSFNKTKNPIIFKCNYRTLTGYEFSISKKLTCPSQIEVNPILGRIKDF